jgi:pilus assembly protein CpaE
MTILYEHLEQPAMQIASLLGPDVAVVAAPSALLRRLTADPSERLVLFGPGTVLAEATDFAERCRLFRPGLAIVLLRQHLDEATVAAARAAGVREIVHAADGAGIVAACARARQVAQPAPSPPLPPAAPTVSATATVPPAPPAPAPAPPVVPAAPPEPPAADEGSGGRVIAVFSGKGGAGKSVIATNLAVSLASDENLSVCLIDLDLAFGDVGILLQLSPDRTLAHAIPVAERLDETGLRTLLTQYRPNLDVLLAPVAPAEAEQIGRALVTRVIALARASFDYVVVDCASQFSEPVLAALDAAHFHVLVTTPELPALKGNRVTLDMFDLLDYREDGRLVVLNRAETKVGVSAADAEKVLRARVAAHVPSSRDVPVSVNKGVPIVQERPNHAVSVAIRALAAKHFVPDTAGKPRGLRRLVGRRNG